MTYFFLPSLFTVNVLYLLNECISSDLVGLLQVRRLLDQVKFKGETAAKTLLQYLEQTEPTRPNPEDKESHLSAGMDRVSFFMSLSLMLHKMQEMGIIMMSLLFI